MAENTEEIADTLPEQMSEQKTLSDEYSVKPNTLPTRPLSDIKTLARGAQTRLAAWRGRTEKGQPRDLLTPFGSSEGRQTITSRLLEIATENVDDRIADLEMNEAKKVGTLSIMLPWVNRRGTLAPYWTSPDTGWDTSLFMEAEQRVSAMVPQSLRPLTFDNAAERLPSNTALGLPLVSSDSNAIPEYLERARNLSSVFDIYPSICYWRGQAEGPGEVPKQRIVWGFDHAETIASGRYLHPTLEVLKTRPEFAAWQGPDEVDRQVYTYLRPFAESKEGSRYISVDYSGFDTSVSREMISMAFRILRKWFPGEDEMLEILEEVFSTSGMVTPDGWHFGRDGAVPSGSALTNLIDTIVNSFIVEYSSLKRGQDVRYLALGDDTLVAGSLTAEDLAEDAKELGFEVGLDKSRESDETADFLRRLYIFEDGWANGVASIVRRASSLSGYERFRKDWNQYLEAMRNIMLLEVCKYHPRLPEFVEYIADNDRVLASTDPLTIASRAGGSKKIESMLGVESYRGSGRRVSELAEFASVRLLQEKRFGRTSGAV